MARKKTAADEADPDQQHGEGESLPGVTTEGAGAPEGDSQEPTPPPRANNELLPCVESAGSTITGCSESEVKNYLATMDYACRQACIQVADLWKVICKTAQKNGKGGNSSAKVSLSIKLDVDHSNILLMDTAVKTAFAEKHSESAHTQEDLRQTTFALKTA